MSLEDLKDFVRERTGQDHYVDPRQSHDQILPSGFYALDDLLAGGLRSGSFVELYGAPSSGKTLLALNFAAQGQKLWEKPILYMDFEHAWNPGRAEEIGVDVDYVVRAVPPTQEDGFDLLKDEIKTNNYSVIIVDSISAMLPERENETKMRDQNVALNARTNSKGFRVITPGLADTVVIFINQIRDNVGQMFGNPLTTSGGHALKHYMHTRIGISKVKPAEKREVERYDAAKGGMVKQKVEPGHVMRLKLEKSRFNSPGMTCDLYYSYALSDVDRFEDLKNYLSDPERSLVKTSGPFFEVSGREKKVKGKKALRELFESDPELVRSLIAQTPLGRDAA